MTPDVTPALAPYHRKLNSLRKHNLHRSTITLTSAQEPVVEKEGEEFVCLASNNYLGLTTHPAVREAAQEAVQTYGSGSGAARLITGNFDLYEQLENTIARFKNTEDALVFGSGYATNIGTLQALTTPKSTIYYDEYNHASIIDGIRLSGANQVSYEHGNVEDLRRQIQDHPPTDDRSLIVTDGVFSMDGDVAPLHELVDIAKETNLLLMVDDAHGSGVLGEDGRGSVAHFELSPEDVPVQMGTLSKAFGAQGGFVSGTETLIDYLRNRARSFVYSTAPSPAPVAAARAAIQVSIDEPERRKTVHQHIRTLHKQLSDRNLPLTTEEPQSGITSLLIGDVDRSLQFSTELEKRGFLVPAIRPPTVPRRSSRLRISVMATHTDRQIQDAAEAILAVADQLEVPREEPHK